jgi:hypothetical protein
MKLAQLIQTIKATFNFDSHESFEKRLARVKAQEVKKYNEALAGVRSDALAELYVRLDVLAKKLEGKQLEALRNNKNQLEGIQEDNKEVLQTLSNEAEDLSVLVGELETSEGDIKPFTEDFQDGWDETTQSVENSLGGCKRWRQFIGAANNLMKKNELKHLDEVALKDLSNLPSEVVATQVYLFKEALHKWYEYCTKAKEGTEEISSTLKLLNKKKDDEEQEEEEDTSREPAGDPMDPLEDFDL